MIHFSKQNRHADHPRSLGLPLAWPAREKALGTKLHADYTTKAACVFQLVSQQHALLQVEATCCAK